MADAAAPRAMPSPAGAPGPKEAQVGPTRNAPNHPGVLHVATLNRPLGLQNGYGPIESVIHSLDKGLHRAGVHSVVACSGDSRVTGEHFATVPESHGNYCSPDSAAVRERIDQHLARSLVRAARPDIGVVHMHEWSERVLDGCFNPVVPVVVTLHVPAEHSVLGRPARPAPSTATPRAPVYFVAISDFQRKQYEPLIPVAATIHHGIDTAEYDFGPRAASPGYLFSIGRLSAVKGQDAAIEVARRSGQKLILAGCVQDKPEDRAFFAALQPSIQLSIDLGGVPVGSDYFETVMGPLLMSPAQIIYVGELKEEAKKQWYRHAAATLFSIRWGEPFGIVLIESLASGTPVIAFNRGAVPEVIVHGKTGFIVDTPEEMATAVGALPSLSRADVRRHAAEHFSIDEMARGYENLYRKIWEPAAPKHHTTLARTARASRTAATLAPVLAVRPTTASDREGAVPPQRLELPTF